MSDQPKPPAPTQPEKCPKCGRTDCTSGDSTGLCGAGEFFDPENPPLKCQYINLSPTQPSGVGPTWTALILRKDWIEDPDLLGPKGSIRYSNINDAEFYSGGAPGCGACGVVTYGPNDKPHTDNCWLMKIQQALTASPEASRDPDYKAMWESLEKKLEIRLSGYLNNEPGLELSSDLRAIKKEMDDLKGGLK